MQSYFYDKDDRLTTFTDQMGDSTVYGYDGVGNVISVKDAERQRDVLCV